MADVRGREGRGSLQWREDIQPRRRNTIKLIFPVESMWTMLYIKGRDESMEELMRVVI
jgi:hypothetical protein